jgi:hypothetical protein
MKNLIIRDHKGSANSVIFYLPSEFIKLIKNRDIVIKLIDKEIIIRESNIDDIKTIKIHRYDLVYFSLNINKNELIGLFNYEIKDENLIIYLSETTHYLD